MINPHLLFIVICFFGAYYKANKEEKILTVQSPKAYQAYKKRLNS